MTRRRARGRTRSRHLRRACTRWRRLELGNAVERSGEGWGVEDKLASVVGILDEELQQQMAAAVETARADALSSLILVALIYTLPPWNENPTTAPLDFACILSRLALARALISSLRHMHGFFPFGTSALSAPSVHALPLGLSSSHFDAQSCFALRTSQSITNSTAGIRGSYLVYLWGHLRCKLLY
ncbi:hypothetical protein C8J57DRAFT_1715755 [Mycena rebaudengoi]|nr:hypothetical protein C8J57DRAFT_1715755 [Mycena rebaudengoi]